jgi:YfiH family protein
MFSAMRNLTLADIPLLSFESLAQPGLTHCVTTKAGGVSIGQCQGLNLGHGHDSPEAVSQNLETLRAALGLERIVWAKQVHGTSLVAINGDENGPVAEADGLATDQPGVGLLIKQADCQAVILAAPERGVIANLHVGWRGNVANMPAAGVKFLEERYGVEPSELWVAISPSLGPCCAEFVNHATELPPEWGLYSVRPNYFDLWQVTWDQLNAAGVRPERIEMSGICTKCSPKFYSYRREGITGRFGTVVALTPEAA